MLPIPAAVQDRRAGGLDALEFSASNRYAFVKNSNLTLIAEQQITSSVRLEPVIVLMALALAAWLYYRFLMKNLSAERHRLFRGHFSNLVNHLVIGFFWFLAYEALEVFNGKPYWLEKAQVYTGLFAVIAGCIIFIKILRIIAFEYLFTTSGKAGVPLLLVNILTLITSVVMLAWIMTRIFEIQLAPLMATSALLSIVLGLALQDTLGNLFSAVALQFDKPFDLGDWIEIKNGSDKIVGQVQEVSWRSTVLLAITDEIITVPNRYMSQSQISNFAGRERPFIRSHVFRIPLDGDVPKAKAVLVETALRTEGVLRDPAPIAIVTEAADSWVAIKLVYSIHNYGSQFSISDRFLTTAVDDLRRAGITLATPRMTIDQLKSA